MVDPISDVGTVDEEDAPRCDVCGDSIVNDPAHRVLTWIEDGLVAVRHFCSEACLESWRS